MNENRSPFSSFADRSLFLVWGPPSHGPRSQVFAKELGIRELHFIDVTSKRGAWIAPFKYMLQALLTFSLLLRKKPNLIFVQSPPGLAVLVVYFYCAITGSRYIVDAHSAALQLPFWTKPRWFWSALARKALMTIVTNEHFENMLKEWRAPAMVLHDIPTTFPNGAPYPMNGSFNITVVNTFSSDEPLEEILRAAQEMEGVKFYITGKVSRAAPAILELISKNVVFTDFLSTERYYALMRTSHAVMCLTTRNHTMQRGACEALSMGKPIVTSQWPLLQEYFNKGTVHVDNTSSGIRSGVNEMKTHYDRYQLGIRELQVSQQVEWQKKIGELVTVVRSALEA